MSSPNFGQKNRYVHDFGSILAFIEWNFKIPIGTIGQDNYPFADYYAPERQANPPTVPLMDFFVPQTRGFTPINIPPGYPVSYFQQYFQLNQNASPNGPDAGEGDGAQD